MNGGESPNIREDELDQELARLKEKMAKGPSNNVKPDIEKPSASVLSKPRTETEAQERLAALKREVATGVPADVSAGQEITEEEVRKKLAELAEEVESGKKSKRGGKKIRGSTSQPGDDLLRGLARSGNQATEAVRQSTEDLARISRETRNLLKKKK